MTATNNRRKVAWLTNMIAPYRLPLFAVLGDQFDLLVLHGGREANRDSWGNADDILSNAKVVRAWGWQIPFKQKLNGKVFNERLFHITPGLIWHLLRFRPDAVISGEMGFRTTVALAYGTIFRKPVWIWWEGTRHSERKIDSLRKGLRKIVTFWADRWITSGVTATEYLLDLGVKRETILQSQNSVDEEQFQAAVEPAWLLRPRPVVLYVGRFVELKGVGLLLDAAATLQRAGREFSLILVGDGREKQALEQRAAELGLKNVHFQHAQPPEKMPSVYRSADLVVFPTLQDVWGFVANEAVLSGVPVLCSKYAGCAAELFPAENIFSPDDSGEFVEKLGAAIAGQLSKVDPTRLKTTEYLGRELVDELNRFIRRGASNQQPDPEAFKHFDVPRDTP
jgi:glycosyltransferase involved in cell wall biosynthesis